MEAERIIPWAAGGALLVAALVASRSGGNSFGPAGYNVIQAGGDYSDRVAAAGIYRDLELGRLADTTQRLSVEAGRDTAMESLRVAESLGAMQERAQVAAVRELGSTRRAELVAQSAAAEARELTQRQATAAQQRTSVVTQFLSFVGSIVGTIVGLSGDGAYYASLRDAGVPAEHARTQWAIVRRGTP